MKKKQNTQKKGKTMTRQKKELVKKIVAIYDQAYDEIYFGGEFLQYANEKAAPYEEELAKLRGFNSVEEMDSWDFYHRKDEDLPF